VTNRSPNTTLPTRALRKRAASLLPWVDVRLRETYQTAPLGNKRNPLDELIYIQLSVRTREGAYFSTYPALRRLVGGAWARLREIPESQVFDSIRAGGMAQMKVHRILGMLDGIAAKFGRVTLAPLRRMTNAEAEEFLRSLPGVGPKVARCVLLYSLDRAVFPVDSHCRRVLARLGLLPTDVDIKAAHDFLQALVPVPIRGSLHVNLVHHGRAVCLPLVPRCEGCVLVRRCATGQTMVATRRDQPALVRVAERSPRVN
jgi:endonuclease III